MPLDQHTQRALIPIEEHRGEIDTIDAAISHARSCRDCSREHRQRVTRFLERPARPTWLDFVDRAQALLARFFSQSECRPCQGPLGATLKCKDCKLYRAGQRTVLVPVGAAALALGAIGLLAAGVGALRNLPQPVPSAVASLRVVPTTLPSISSPRPGGVQLIQSLVQILQHAYLDGCTGRYDFLKADTATLDALRISGDVNKNQLARYLALKNSVTRQGAIRSQLAGGCTEAHSALVVAGLAAQVEDILRRPDVPPSPDPSPSPATKPKVLRLFDARRDKRPLVRDFKLSSSGVGALCHAGHFADPSDKDWQILHYRVQADDFAAFALELPAAAGNWSSRASGELVLRVKRMDPNAVKIPSTVIPSIWGNEEDRILHTLCADTVVVRLWSGAKESSVKVRLDTEQKKQVLATGSLDLRIRLHEFGQVTGMPLTTLSLEFKGEDVNSRNHGNLGIQFILVTSQRDQTLEDLDRDADTGN